MGYFGIIYKVTNKINGKIYIGQTIRKLKLRKLVHENRARLNKDNLYFHNAIRKYGKENFDWDILEQCSSKEELDLAEKWYIRYYRTFINFNNCCGYNMTFGGKGTVGWLPNKETIEKHKQYKPSKETIAKIIESRKWYKHSEETKKKQSKAKKGKKPSKEARRKMSRSQTGKKRLKSSILKGIKTRGWYRPSEETKKKIADTESFWWLVIFPNGSKKIIKNLNAFCRENGLYHGNMIKVAQGIRKHSKGFSCKRLYKIEIKFEEKNYE